MKLNETALYAAAQKFWEGTGRRGAFPEDTPCPGVWTERAAHTVTYYLDALDAEGLADLYEYWCERIEALPIPDKVHTGDTVAYYIAMGRWLPHICNRDLSPVPDHWRVLRRAPRQWKIGDLVDETRDLPGGAVIRDEGGEIAEYGRYDLFYVAGIESAVRLDRLSSPRIIWLPEEGEK